MKNMSKDLDLATFGSLVIALREDKLFCIAICITEKTQGRGSDYKPLISWAGKET